MSQRVQLSVVAALLGVQGGMLAFSANVHSPTLLEPAQLVSGIAVWKYGRFDLFNVNPPLVRMIAALPVLASDAVVDDLWYTPRQGVPYAPTIGNDFIRANGGWRSIRYFTLARWACIPLVLIGGLVCYLWAAELHGALAGLVAMTLWSFDPNILGHGSLITNDIPAAALGLLASYALWRWLTVRTWSRAVAAGLALGCALLAKLTWLVLLVVWPALWICSRVREPRGTRRSTDPWVRVEVAQLAAAAVTALYLVNVCYGFDRTGTRLGEFDFVSEALGGEAGSAGPRNRFSGSCLGMLPLPLPKPYVAGVDAQRTDFEHYHSPSYLRGEWKQGGWWHYYAYGLLVKMPHGTQTLVFLAALLSLGKALGHHGARPGTRGLLPLLAPAAVVFALVSSQTAFNHHIRYVWPCLGMFIVFGASAAASRSRRVRAVAFSSVLLTAASSLAEFPHGISYFNEFAGGPGAAGDHLIHSNVDWGQDLLYLKAWCDANAYARPLFVACVSAMPPADAGLLFPEPPRSVGDQGNPPELAPGWYAVSVNYLRGAAWGTPHGAYEYFRERQPFARVGYSIYLYHVSQSTTPELTTSAHKHRAAAQSLTCYSVFVANRLSMGQILLYSCFT